MEYPIINYVFVHTVDFLCIDKHLHIDIRMSDLGMGNTFLFAEK